MGTICSLGAFHIETRFILKSKIIYFFEDDFSVSDTRVLRKIIPSSADKSASFHLFSQFSGVVFLCSTCSSMCFADAFYSGAPVRGAPVENHV